MQHIYGNYLPGRLDEVYGTTEPETTEPETTEQTTEQATEPEEEK